MGGGFYSSNTRTARATTKGYDTKPRDEIFEQSKVRRIHEDMDPKNVKYREACDSEDHPKTVPIQLYLDVTGSMGEVPHHMIKEGLPKLITTLIEAGIKDVALMFGGIGDHICDSYPLQIGQFESADAPLDMWLERTYIEGGGGGNGGESYLLAWYFAAKHTKLDAFMKRGKKGFVFTVGDEPPLMDLPISALKKIMGNNAVGEGNMNAESLLKLAQKQNHVYHIHIDHHGGSDYRLSQKWKALLGENVVVINDYTKLDKTISNIVLSRVEDRDYSMVTTTDADILNDKKEETNPVVML